MRDYIPAPDCHQQTCKVCWRPDKFDFQVPDSIWKAIVPQKFQGHVVCFYCFDEFARLKGIEYHTHLKNELYFAGKQATFIFKVAKRFGC